MAMSCGQASKLSVASAGGHTTRAERLELEAHLATCARCSAEHALVLATTRSLRAAEPDALSASARDRVWRAAIARRAHAPVTARRFGWPFGAGAVLAMAAAVAIWIGMRRPSDISVIAGDVTMTPGPVAASGEATGGAVTLRSGRGGEVRLADASAALAPTTEIVWRHERRVVELREGALTVDVAHRPGQHFEVRTPRFVVEVVGTRFSVDLAGVRTERGTVRVLSPDGKVYGYLEGGHSWTIPDGASHAEAPAPPVPPTEAPAPPPSPPSGVAAATSAATPEDTAGVRLGRARRALARGRAGEARRIVEPLFRLGRDVAAEARAIYAESYLIEGRHADASAGYEVVVRDFPTTPQAESALYAIAQLESEHGRPAEARATLQRYLARYPNGRFAKEATGRLARLSPPQPR
jgi:ferric-dicitrate binding protein FerR (iron transport regulator)